MQVIELNLPTISPNPSGAPGILCLSCVNANSVATGMSSTSPRCLNPKKTVVIMTSAKIIVIIPGGDQISVCASWNGRGKTGGRDVHIAIVETMLYDLTSVLRVRVIVASTSPAGTAGSKECSKSVSKPLSVCLSVLFREKG